MAKKGNEKLVSILSYFIIGIIWYFVDEKIRKSNMVKFHVKQAMNLVIISIVLGIIFSWMAFWAFGVFYLIYLAIRFVLLVLWIIGLINAIHLRQKEIPLIGWMAEKYLTF